MGWVPRCRGLHSSTFQLDLSALYGIGGARWDCVARIKGELGGVKGVKGVFLCQTRLKLSWAVNECKPLPRWRRRRWGWRRWRWRWGRRCDTVGAVWTPPPPLAGWVLGRRTEPPPPASVQRGDASPRSAATLMFQTQKAFYSRAEVEARRIG
jgi:hypothetical protein